MGKKGATEPANVLTRTISIIIVFIILILFIAFGLYVYLMGGLGGGGGVINKQTCKQSIEVRSGLNYGVISASTMMPLKCKTERLCITKGTEQNFIDPCEDAYGKFTKDNVYSLKFVNTRQDVIKVLAASLYDCYDMVGKGQADFMPHENRQRIYGLPCYRIAFGKKVINETLAKSGGDITYIELYSYMMRAKVKDLDIISTTGENSLLNEIYGIQDSVQLRTLITNKLEEWKKVAKDKDQEIYKRIQDMTLYDWKIDSKTQYVIISSIAPAGTLTSKLKAGGVVAGVVIGLFTAGLGLGLAAGAGAVTGGIVLFKNNPDNKYEFISPTFYPWNVDYLRQINADEYVFSA